MTTTGVPLADSLKQLRAPFPPEKIGKLPRGKVELDYVGHADVTERLLDVDPAWNWEPMATSPDGSPMMTYDTQARPIGLWIKLTVCGITRIGFGSVAPGAFDAEKQLIGDALRNAAMRFGVALDLWRKEPPADDKPVETPARSRGADARPKIKVVSREPLGRFCPLEGGELELIQWDNGASAVCCSHWREKDGACKYREAPEAAHPEGEGFHDPEAIPF